MSDTQKNKKLNVPNLRFPGFEGEWKQYTMGELTELFSRRNKKRINFPMFSVTNSRGFVNQQEQFENREMKGEDIAAYKIISPGEYAYNPARINVGSIARYDGDSDCMISSLYVCFKAKKELVDSQLLLHILKSPKMVYNYGINGEGGVRIYLFYPNFARIRVKLPGLDEQKKIASFLDVLEKRIEIQNRIIERYESLIKALAFKVIGSKEPHTRLYDCVVCTSSTLKESELIDDGIPSYGASGISGYSAEALCESDSILITKDGSGVGTKRYVHGAHSFVGTLCSLTPKKGIYLPYIYYALINMNFDAYKTGQAIPHVYFKDYGKALLFCPSHSEQIKLAQGLEYLDRKVSYERETLLYLCQLKTFLLSQLFI